MATSPITAKIFAGEALDEAEKRALTQEQEWLHVLLQAGNSAQMISCLIALLKANVRTFIIRKRIESKYVV